MKRVLIELININTKGPYFLNSIDSNWMIELVSNNKQIYPKNCIRYFS
jgi:hypothetical protein